MNKKMTLRMVTGLLIAGMIIQNPAFAAVAENQSAAPVKVETVVPVQITTGSAQGAGPFKSKRPPMSAKEMKALKAQADAYFKGLAAENKFSGSVLVTQDGKTIYEGAFGMANRTYDLPAKIDTKYLVGSVSKQFTAAAVLKLVEAGKLKLEDPVTKYLPDYPGGDAITLHQLLTHTSGIPDFTKGFGKEFNYAREYSVSDLMALFANQPLNSTPGEKYAYNNSDYVLLGAVIEKVTGTTLENYMKENFFKPFGMKNTGFFKNAEINKNLAAGYRMNGQTVLNGQYMDGSLAYGCGMLYSNTQDISKWNQALYGNKVLSPELTRLMTTARVKIPGTYSSYGYGLSTGKEFNRTYTGHNGDVSGYAAHDYTYVDQGVSIIILTNIERLRVYSMAMELSPMIFNDAVIKPAEPKAYEIPANEYTLYTGTFRNQDYGVDVLLSREGNRISAQVPMYGKFLILPQSKQRFISEKRDAVVEFSDFKDGQFQKAMLQPYGYMLTRVK